MEDEKFISGYCRQTDRNRIVTAELACGAVTAVDCCYGSCIYQAGCPIARELDEMQAHP